MRALRKNSGYNAGSVEEWQVTRRYSLEHLMPNGNDRLTLTGEGDTPEEALQVLDQRRRDIGDALFPPTNFMITSTTSGLVSASGTATR